jgi:hypothetical protein
MFKQNAKEESKEKQEIPKSKSFGNIIFVTAMSGFTVVAAFWVVQTSECATIDLNLFPAPSLELRKEICPNSQQSS